MPLQNALRTPGQLDCVAVVSMHQALVKCLSSVRHHSRERHETTIPAVAGALRVDLGKIAVDEVHELARKLCASWATANNNGRQNTQPLST